MLKRALEDLAGGKPVLLYDLDGREAETDMVTPGQSITPGRIYTLRSEAGGLICASLPSHVARKLKLPYLHEIFKKSSSPIIRDISSYRSPYGGHPAFSVAVNHVDTYTGITDRDRSKTIGELSKLVGRVARGGNDLGEEFSHQFRSPGHVNLLIGEDLSKRQGHTELSLKMAEIAGLDPVMVICEMLDGRTGRALTKELASAYADSHNLQFVEGGEIMEVIG